MDTSRVEWDSPASAPTLPPVGELKSVPTFALGLLPPVRGRERAYLTAFLRLGSSRRLAVRSMPTPTTNEIRPNMPNSGLST
jgi:hypothetical protein